METSEDNSKSWNNFTKVFLVILLLSIISMCVRGQDLPDYSQSDPDNIVNNEYDTSQTPTWEELGERFSVILDTLMSKPAYKTVEESNTLDGLKKDFDTLVDKIKNSKFVKSIEETETVKGIKKDMEKETDTIKVEVKVKKVPPKKKKVS